MSSHSDSKVLNQILRSEMIAVKTYDGLLQNDVIEPQAWRLHAIADGHRRAVDQIRQHFEDVGELIADHATTQGWQGVVRDDDHGVWNDRALLTALRNGEAHQAEHCRWALTPEAACEPGRHLIGDRLVPMLDLHVATLDSYLAST